MLFKICGLFILGAGELPWAEALVKRPSDAERVARRARPRRFSAEGPSE